VPNNNDFPVSLRCHALALSISVTSEVRSDFTGPVETCIETSICLEAGEGKFMLAFVSGVTGDDDSPIAMHSHAVAKVVGTEVGSRLAGFVEARIKSPIRGVAYDRKIIFFSVDERVACNDDLSVALYRHAVCTAVPCNTGCYLSGLPKACVEAAVRGVP